MALVPDALGYPLLRRFWPDGPRAGSMDGSAYAHRSKLITLLGPALLAQVAGKRVLDFGCGTGAEAVELAEHGAEAVIGLDIQEHLLDEGRVLAAAHQVANRVEFVNSFTGTVDLIITIDSFEHFSDPAEILSTMHDLLVPSGRVLASFGPTWYHPLGGHLFSVFPWAHLVFGEQSLVRWRGHFKQDGATSFASVAGGLNQMTVRRFESLVAHSRLRLIALEAVPIRRLRWVASRFTREFTTAIVRATLERPTA